MYILKNNRTNRYIGWAQSPPDHLTDYTVTDLDNIIKFQTIPDIKFFLTALTPSLKYSFGEADYTICEIQLKEVQQVTI